MSNVEKVGFLLDYIQTLRGRLVQIEGYASEVEAHRGAVDPGGLSIEEGAPQHKRKRKPSMADAARLAAREGVEVRIAPDGTIIATPVKPLDIAPTDTTRTGNEWDRLQ